MQNEFWSVRLKRVTSLWQHEAREVLKIISSTHQNQEVRSYSYDFRINNTVIFPGIRSNMFPSQSIRQAK